MKERNNYIEIKISTYSYVSGDMILGRFHNNDEEKYKWIFEAGQKYSFARIRTIREEYRE